MTRVGFTFIWKIENFSFVPKFPKDEELLSPIFLADNLYKTHWCLRLRPAGYCKDNNNEFLFILYKISTFGSQNTILLDYELSVLYNGHLKEKSVTVSAFWYHSGNSYGTPLAMTLGEIFSKGGILPRDTLTVQCKMWHHEELCSRPISILARTRFDAERVFFNWAIDKFSTLEVNNEKSTSIVMFSKHRVYLTVTFFITGGPDEGEKFQVKIEGRNEEKNSFSKLVISVLDKNDESVHQFENEFMLKKENITCIFPFILDKKQLIESKVLLCDILYLKCELFVFSVILNIIEFSAYNNNSAFDLESGLTKTHGLLCLGKRKRHSSLNSFSNDLRYLFEEKHYADVSLQVNDETFPVHKAILAARSSVFKTMFETNMKEKLTSTIKIDDIQPDTMRQLLLYIYSNTMDSDIQWELACNLYMAAEKYDICDLKKKCSSYLMAHLNVSNICKTLLLADMLRDEDLKDFIQSFLEEKDKEVLNSNEWKDFIVNHPQLSINTLTRLYRNVKQI